jgi:hypothetical protein
LLAAGVRGQQRAAKFATIKAALAEMKGIRWIARDLQTGVGTVRRIKAELAVRKKRRRPP